MSVSEGQLGYGTGPGALTPCTAGLPLSPIQQGMLAESLVSSDRGVNVEQVIGELEEPLDTEKFRRAWQHALESFDAFRLCMSWPDGDNPTQHVIDTLELPFELIESTGPDAKAALESFLEKDRRAGFDLYQAPLFRVSVLRFSESRWAFVWTIHHSIIDGGVYRTVISFVFETYQALLDGRLPPVWGAPPYQAFLHWLGAHDKTPGVRHFQKLLEGFEELTELPYQSGSERQPSRRTHECSEWLSLEQTQAVEQAAKAAQVTTNTLLQLCWGLWLGRYAGRDDVVFGATWSGRAGTIAGAQQIVGPFINTLPVRLDVSHGPSVRQALAELRQQHLALRPYQHTPLAEIKAASGLAGAAQLFETNVVFEYERFFSLLEREDPRFAGRKFSSRSQTTYPLGLVAHLEAARLRLMLDYDTGLYDAATARKLLGDYVRLVVEAAASLDTSVHALKLLDPDTYDRLTRQQVAREQVPPEPSALSRVWASVSLAPERTAIEEIRGGGQLSYGDLKKRALTLARRLVARGVRPGDIVGILVPRSIDAVVGMLAVHAAGAAFLPLDPSNPDERLKYMLEDSQARIVLVNSTTEGKLQEARSLELAIDAEDSTAGELSLPEDPTPASAVAYVIYTSGSTGQPKGVCISHAALANHLAGTLALFELTPEDRVLQFTALSFDVSIEEILPTLAARATLCLRSDEMARSARDFFDAIGAARISVLNLPTAFWHQMVHAELRWPEHLRFLAVGGERVGSPQHAKFREANTHHIRFINGYGPTETTITSTVYDDRSNDHDKGDVPIGMPVRGLSHFALDQRMRPVVPGTVGQLFIGGAGLALGYLRREELTRERFVPHPWREGARLYATGDLVRQTPRGNYVYVDRVDNQVKVRGFRIELGEIEARLSTHPAVEEAVVVVQQSGQDANLVGFATVDDEVTSRELRQHLAAALPAYMVPTRVVVERDLPKTPAGKVDRRGLAQRVLPRAVQNTKTTSDHQLERDLLEIWSELLKTPVSDANASFFELGGNSLVAVQMFTQVEKRLGKTCKVTDFFKNPTAAALRDLIENHDGTDWKSPRLHLAHGKPRALPIFLAPSVTGRAIDYVHLASELGHDHPVYALQIRGLRDGEELHTDLTSAANFYADLMQEVQPKGPYVVAGFSAGGTISLAIAEVLLDRGESMAMVAVLDSAPPVPTMSPFTSLTRLRRLGRTAVGRVRLLLRGPEVVSRLSARTASALKRGAAIWLPFSIENTTKVEGLFVGAGVELSEAETHLMQSHLNAIMAYTSKNYPVDILLFRTDLDPFEGPHEHDLGWSRAVTGKIVIDSLPCQHHELLTRDGAPRLAALLRPHLARLPRRDA